MANLYGVANAPTLTVTIGSTNFAASPTCTANAWTTIATSPPLIAPSQGYFYAFVSLTAVVGLSASLPGNLFFAAAIGAGSFVTGISITGGGMVASATLQIAGGMCTPISQTAWQGAGSTVTLGCQPTTNSVVVSQFSSATIILMRAADQ